MKKCIALCLPLIFAVSVDVYSIGLGAQFAFKAQDDLVVGPSLLLWEPRGTHMGIDWNIEKEVLSFGLTLDLCYGQFEIIDLDFATLNFGVGPGIFGNFKIPKEKVYSKDNPKEYKEEYNFEHTDWQIGLRIPLLLYLSFTDRYNQDWATAFLQVAPAVSMVFEPSFGFGGFKGSAVSFGFIFWL